VAQKRTRTKINKQTNQKKKEEEEEKEKEVKKRKEDRLSYLVPESWNDEANYYVR